MSFPLFKDLFGGGKPYRRVLKGRVATDADGKLVFQPQEGQAHVISDEDSLDTIEPDFDAFLDCGCTVKTARTRFHCCEPGCPHVSCENHVRYCQVCAKRCARNVITTWKRRQASASTSAKPTIARLAAAACGDGWARPCRVPS